MDDKYIAERAEHRATNPDHLVRVLVMSGAEEGWICAAPIGRQGYCARSSNTNPGRKITSMGDPEPV
jgi:hypothetical protein